MSVKLVQALNRRQGIRSRNIVEIVGFKLAQITTIRENQDSYWIPIRCQTE